MNSKDLVLNIAVNMGRLCRFALEGREQRVNQFIKDSETYLDELENKAVNPRFQPTLEKFKQDFASLKNSPLDNDWAEKALTWANILQHRAKLA